MQESKYNEPLQMEETKCDYKYYLHDKFETIEKEKSS